MTLRTSLIITGDAEGGKKAVRDLGQEMARAGSQADNLVAAQRRAETASKGVVKAANQQRAAYVQLGQQTQDVFAQTAAGTNAFIIFAQQSGQVASAMTGLGGRVGALAGFLAGPLGAALTGAIALFGVMATKTDEAADKARKHGEAARTLKEAIEDLDKATGRLTRNQDQEIAYRAAVTKAIQQQTIETKKQTQALLSQAIAEHEVTKARSQAPGTRGEIASLGLEQESAQIGALQDKLAELDRQIADAEKALRTAEVKLITSKTEERRDPAKAADAAYQRKLRELNEQYSRGEIQSQRELAQAISAAADARDRAVKAAQDQAKASRESERAAKAETATLAQMRAAVLDLHPNARITSGLRTRAEQDALIARGVTKARNSRHLTGQAIDVAPIAGVKFEDFVKQLRDRGFNIVEAKNERGGRNDGTGAHWHIAWTGGREAVKTLQDMAKAQDEQLASLAALEKKYDPLAAVAREYREELEKIATLQGAGKLDTGAADEMRRAVALKRFDDEEKIAKDAAKAWGAIADDFNADMLSGVKTASELIDQDMGAAMRRAAEELQRGGMEAADAIADVFGYKFARIFAEVTGGAGSGDAIGQLLSGFGQGKADFTAKAGEQLEGVFKKVFGGSGDFANTMGKTLGAAYAGAQFGGAIGKGLTDVLGVKGSKLGGQIGGAIGGAIAGPLGSIVGGILGSLAGGLFKKAKTGTATVGVVNGVGDVTGTGGNNESRISAARGLASGALGALDQIISALGADYGSFAGSIGIRDKKFVVDPTGKGRTKGSGVQKFKTEEEAQAALLKDLIADGAVKGLSAAVQRALGSSPDIEKGLKEALKVQEVELLIGGIGSEMEKAFRDFERQASERVRIARQYGFDLAKLEELNAKERLALTEKLTEQQVGSLQRLVDEMMRGSLFEGSKVDQRTKLLEEIGKAQGDVDAGKEGAADTLAGLLEQLNTVSKEVYGTTGGFAVDRNAILDQARAAIAKANERIAAAQAKASDPALATTNKALDENNDQNARIIAALGDMNDLLRGFGAGSGGGFAGLMNAARMA